MRSSSKASSFVGSPFFNAEGQLIREPGYHRKSQVFLSLSRDLDIPDISDKPTEEEVFEAKRLLIEEVLADFPLGAKTVVEALAADLVFLPPPAHLSFWARTAARPATRP